MMPENVFHNFEHFLEKHFVNPDGVVYSQIDAGTLRPTDAGTFAGTETPAWYPPGMTLSDFWSYENCGMTTGGYLSALCTMLADDRRKDRERLRTLAQRTFRALHHIYSIGCQWEEGFFPKIWGNRFSRQTSTDQYLYAMFAMDQYYPTASEEERGLIRKMIPAMAEFWRKRNYTLTYYLVKDMVWPPLRFPPLLLLACKYAPEESRKEEALRILSENLEKIPENSRRKSGRLYHLADAVTMDVMNLSLMLESEFLPSSFRPALIAGMEKIWSEARQTLTEDGFYWTSMPCDCSTGIVIPGTEAQYGARSAWSTMVVRAGLQLSAYVPSLTEETRAQTEKVLAGLAPETMYYYHPADVGKLEPSQQYKVRFLSGDAIVNWLWAKALLENNKPH